MSNSNSALVRSNLGRNGAVALASNLAPRIIDALTRRIGDLAVQRVAGSSSGGQIPVNRSGRRRRGKRRATRGGSSPAGPPIYSNPNAILPLVRRTLKFNTPAFLLTQASGLTSNYMAQSIGVIGPTPLLAENIMGTLNVKFLSCYPLAKVHKVKSTFTPIMSATSALAVTMAFSTRALPVPITGHSDFNAATQFKAGGPTGAVSLEFVPTNVHGGVISTGTGASDDPGEMSAGYWYMYLSNSGAAAGTLAGLVTFEVDITCFDQ